jgi:hypothetical protein
MGTGVKWSGREVDHSHPTNAEVKKCGSIHSPIRLHGVVLNYLNTGTTLLFFTFTLQSARETTFLVFNAPRQCPLVLGKAGRIEDGAFRDEEGKAENKDLFRAYAEEGSS